VRQIGRNVHLSGGVGIEAASLEPLSANPTNRRGGQLLHRRAASEIVEGVVVEEKRG